MLSTGFSGVLSRDALHAAHASQKQLLLVSTTFAAAAAAAISDTDVTLSVIYLSVAYCTATSCCTRQRVRIFLLMFRCL